MWPSRDSNLRLLNLQSDALPMCYEARLRPRPNFIMTIYVWKTHKQIQYYCCQFFNGWFLWKFTGFINSFYRETDLQKWKTVKPLYTNIRYNNKICYKDNLNVLWFLSSRRSRKLEIFKNAYLIQQETYWGMLWIFVRIASPRRF